MATTLAGAFAQGTHASRPAASSSLEGYCYFETDTNGGTLFQCKSSSWVQLTPGVAAVSATGLTGATAASRYVGATTSGAPVSGTFAVGDFIIDQTGAVWVCKTAGTPGTWVSASGGGVTSITGTANEIIASASTGAVTLSTPQAIGTGSSPTFASITAGGLTGATAASRYVGATASGAPASGTFSTGDYVIDQTGKVWICTAGGSPGTWTQVGVVSLTTASSVAGSNTTMTSSNTYYTAVSVTVAAGTWLLVAIATCGTATSDFTMRLHDGTNPVASYAVGRTGIGGGSVSLTGVALVTPSGSTTYSLQCASDNAGDTIRAAIVTNAAGNTATQIVAVKVA